MKGIYAVIIWFLCFFLWPQWESGIALTFSGVNQGGENRLGSIWEGRVFRHSGYNAAAGFFLWSDPAAYDQAETLARMSLFLDTPYLSAGALKLSGWYDMAESRRIPSCSVLLEKGSISPDRDGPLAATCGATLHTADKGWLVHILRRQDYSQTGILWQTGSESSFFLKTLLLYSWNGKPSVGDEKPWYTAQESRTEAAVVQGITGIGYGWEESPVRWTLSGMIQGQCSPALLPGYAGYLILEAVAPSWELGISWQENGGYLRNCRGEGTDWSRGLGWDGEGRMGDLYLKSKGVLYQPGFFDAGPGVNPRTLSPAGEGRLTLGLPFFYCRREWNGDPLNESYVCRDSFCLIYKKDRWAGRAVGERQEGDSSWTRRIGGFVKWKSPSLLLEGGADVFWEEEEFQRPESLKWKVKGEWLGLSRGKISLSLKGEEISPTGERGKFYGELTFESEGF